MAASRRYFALFGAKTTGKTVYLASLYSSSGDAANGGLAYHVSASEGDDSTHSYLGSIGRAMKAARWPDSNPFEHLAELKLRFTMGDMARELVLPEVGGEITRRDRQEQPELKKEILASYQDYHGYLLFVPANVTDPGQATEFKWELDALLNVLRERIPEGRTKIARPIAVLVTKWDLIEPGPLTDASEARATAFFETVHPDQAAGLGTLCENLRVFPVSATGPLVEGRPPVPLRPTNLGEPIAWLVETAERVMLEGAVDYSKRNRTVLFRRARGDSSGRTHYRIALERLGQFLEDLPHGPLAEAARARVAEVKAIGRRRRKRRLGIVVSIVLGLAGLGIVYHDRLAYLLAYQLLEASAPDRPPREVIDRVRAVIDRPFLSYPVRHVLPWWAGPRDELEAYAKEFESRSFEEISRVGDSLEQDDEKGARSLAEKIASYETGFPDSIRMAELRGFRAKAEKVTSGGEERRQKSRIDADLLEYRSHPDLSGLAEKLLGECETFLKDFPGSVQVPSVNALRAEIQIETIELANEKRFQELQGQLTRAAGSPWVCYQLCTGFLKVDPSHRMADKVSADRERFLSKADEQAWDEVIRHARNYPTLFSEQIARCEEYSHNALFTAHQKDASNLKDRCHHGYDRATYEAIRIRARDGNDPATLQDVRQLCTRYLNAPMPVKTMAISIEAWARWFDGWGEVRELKVRVVSMKIDRDSAWHYHFWASDPWVHATIQVGRKSDSTGDRYFPLGKEMRDLPDELLGPFTWKWGDPEVVVTLTYKKASPPQLATKFIESDLFLVRHLNKRLLFDDSKIAVTLECPEVVPPILAPYKE